MENNPLGSYRCKPGFAILPRRFVWMPEISKHKFVFSGMKFFSWYTIFFTFSCFCSGQGNLSTEFRIDTSKVTDWLKLAQFHQKNNPAVSLEYAKKAFALSEKLNYKNGIADACIITGTLYLASKDYKAAIESFEMARPILQYLNDEAKLGRVYKSLAEAYVSKSFFRQSFDYYREAAVLLKKTNQLKLLNECQDAMANNAVDFGRWRGAVEHYRRSLTLKNNLSDYVGAVNVKSKLSKLFLTLEKYDSALLFNKEVQRSNYAGSDLLTDAVIDEMVILSYLGRQEEAAQAKQNADRQVAEAGNPFHRLKLLVATSGFYMGAKDPVNSKKYFDLAAAKTTEAKSPELAIYGLSLLEEMSNRNGDSATAYRMMKMMDTYKDMFRTENIERISAEIKNYAETGLKEKEIEYLNLVNKLKEEQLSKEEIKQMALLRENILKDSSLANQKLLMKTLETEAGLRSDQLEKQKELSLSLSRENKLKQRMLVNERRNKNLLWLGLGAMTLLGGIIFFQFKKQQKKNRIIKKQSAELEVLNKEIHHRVKNNLQVISSMLDLQSQSLNDDKATAIIKEGIQRVQSMAFIHQNLYQGNSVNGVNMNEYIKMLSNHLFHSYNIRPEKICLHTEIENLSLHTDTAIPLGMILNELISNSLKYAFKNREQGDIWVTVKKTKSELLLRVKDNGIGLPPDFDPENTTSFGYEIIKAFIQKMKARMNIDSINGADIQLIISKFKTAE